MTKKSEELKSFNFKNPSETFENAVRDYRDALKLIASLIEMSTIFNDLMLIH